MNATPGMPPAAGASFARGRLAARGETPRRAETGVAPG